MNTLIAHPAVLIAVAVLLSPLLFPLARFFFDDFETFKSEAGLDSKHDRWIWVLGLPRIDIRLQFKIAGFLGCYGALVFLSYLSVCRAFF